MSSPENWQQAGFGLYIHWPFCQAKCPYCDFNSHVSKSIDQSRWCNAYLCELDRVADETQGRVLNSIFFGGGTPSLMAPETVDQILTRVRTLWPNANDIEITLEANPTSVEAARFAAYHDAGVNRISMGIQALNDADLKALGRLHNVKDAQQAFEIAQHTFDRVSFDLIYARQGQTLENWRAELAQALEMAADHLSLYQLTIENGTAFGDRFARGQLRNLPTDDLAADMYQMTQDITADAGLNAYEISNHAKPGQQSQHNLIYWRGGDYLGIGPGAHGRLTLDGVRYAIDTEKQPQLWLDMAERGNGEKTRTVIPNDEQALEYLMMSLRLSEGSDLDRVKSVVKSNNINNLVDSGHVEIDQNRIHVVDNKRILLNAILAQLVS